MANRYANLPGPSKIKDTYQLINTGFDKVQQDMDAKPDKSIAQVNDVQMGTDDTLTVEGSTGITVTTNQQDKKVIITATGDSTPGPHGPSHNNDGADPIPDLQNVTNEFDAHKADFATDDELGHITLQQLGMRNVLINGNFDIWQRGTSSSSLTYVADRWTRNNVQTIERIEDAPNENSRYSYKFYRADSTIFSASQRVESAIARGLVGKPVTISYFVKRVEGDPANVSTRIHSADSRDDFSSVTQRHILNQPVSDQWEKVEVTFPSLNSNCANGLQLSIVGTGHTSEGALAIAQVQLEVGEIATPFERRSIGLELALCQRYAQLRSTDDVNEVDLRPSMRITPTIVSHDGNFLYDAEL